MTPTAGTPTDAPLSPEPPVTSSGGLLQTLGVQLVTQESLERDVAERADKAMHERNTEIEQKRLDKATRQLSLVQSKVQALELKLNNPRTRISERKRLTDERAWVEEHELAPVKQDIKEITARMVSGNGVEAETTHDYLVRTGRTTAFGTVSAFADTSDSASHQHLRAPGFATATVAPEESPTTGAEALRINGSPQCSSICSSDGDSAKARTETSDENDGLGLDEDAPFGEVSGESSDEGYRPRSKRRFCEPELNVKKAKSATPSPPETRTRDDGDETFYQNRLRDWCTRRAQARAVAQGLALAPDASADDDLTEGGEEEARSGAYEWTLPHPTIADAVISPTLRIPGDIFPLLFGYQKTCVQWLWELHQQKVGGIIGDEMGLGKTVQIIAFLAGLHYSGLLTKPVLVVCPATVLSQWVNEFHTWWPPLRTAILHSIGSGMAPVALEKELDSVYDPLAPPPASTPAAQALVDRIMGSGNVLITTYTGLRIHARHILPHRWGYVVLDEGHKIRNPDSAVSLTCKQLKSHNRIILSGTPIQNNLVELWSLFDFVFPGRLGTLPLFQTQFAAPISLGGYANATNVQVQTGYKCAVALRDLVLPYLLRRVKADVAKDLPQKHEMVLFCKLTAHQQHKYEEFLQSADLQRILSGKRQMLYGVDILRKICNHPDLLEREKRQHTETYGDPTRSGKMQVVKTLLQLWVKEGHRTLLFAQTRQMLDILERFVVALGLSHLRMDGNTPIGKRQPLVDAFNADTAIAVFLLTTKVGGLGVNLTGANRVLIYDPDWNPSTDMQARERAWRLGQKKDVTIYRLMITGSIEEKIYHRQIFKQFLTNKILSDPKQRRFFKMNELHDLFSLGDQNDRGSETADLFNGSEKTFGGSARRLQRLVPTADDDDFYSVAGMPGVSSLEPFQEQAEAGEAEAEAELLAGAGIHSALEHDSIMLSSSPVSVMAEQEATRVAAEAVKALREARKHNKSQLGVPTWTGRFGQGGAPRRGGKLSVPVTTTRKAVEGRPASLVGLFGKVSSPKVGLFGQPVADKKGIFGKLTGTPVSGLSSLSLLLGLRAQPLIETSPLLGTANTLDQIVCYLRSQPGMVAKSQAIITAVGLALKGAQEIATVRQMLRLVADWEKGRGVWVLKEEFRESKAPHLAVAN